MYHLLLTQAEQMCLGQEQLIEPAKRKEKNPEERRVRKKVCKTGEEKKSVRMEKFKWTEEAIQNLIDLRYQKVKMLKETGQELSVQNLWLDVPLRLGLENKLTPDRACQKWNQLVKKYKDIQLKTESGTCTGEELAWPHCGRIRDILEEQWTFPKPPEDSEFDLVQMAWEGRSTKHAKRTRSDIWRHFEKLNYKFARCKLCQGLFSHHSTVSNLKKHLLVKHLASYANLPRTQEMDFENIRDGVKENEDENHGPAKHSNSKIKRSAVWNYFSRLDDSYAECNVCRDTFSYKSSISNLLKHRRIMHPHFKTNFIPIRTFGKPYSRMVAPVNAKAPKMRPSIQGANAEESSVEKESGTVVSTPFANALQAVQEQSSLGLKPSYLWNFFTVIDKDFAECNMCQHKLVYRSGMSNLAKHQRLKHPLTQLANSPQNSNEDDPLTLPEDHDTTQISDVQSVYDADEQNSPSKKYSYIWNFFTDLDHSRAQCKVCKKLLSYRASASNLMKHRRIMHPDLPCFREERRGDSKVVEDQPTPRPVREGVKKRKRSKVWQFFKYVDDVYAMCRMCNKQLSHKYTSTNLLSHKNRMHPDVPLDYFAGEQETPDNDGSVASDSDDGPGFDPPDANDSSDDNHNADFSNNINSIVEVEYRPPRPKVKRKKGEKWSSIWRLFDRVDEKFAECRECKKVFSHRSTNTNLLKHTRNKHPDLFGKFTDLRKDFDNCVNELFDVHFPPPKSPPAAAVNNELPAAASRAAHVPRQEFVIATINKQQPHGYHNEPSCNLPIIFIHEADKTKVVPAAKTTPSIVSHNMSNTSGYTPNNMDENYAHVPSTTFHTFENNAHVPMAGPNTSGNHVHVSMAASNTSGNHGLVPMAALNDNIPVVVSDMSGNNDHTIIQDISKNTVQCSVTTLRTFMNNAQVTNVVPKVCGNNCQVTNIVPNVCGNNGQVTNIVSNVCGNNGQITNVVSNVCGNNSQATNSVPNMCVNNSQVTNAVPNVCGNTTTPPSDRLLSVVRESNQLLRGMQSAIQRQSDVMRRLAESIETMRARNQEKLLTD